MTVPLIAIQVDRHAIRFGEPPAGWIIVYKVAEGQTHSDVRNTIFATEEEAIRQAAQVHVAWHPIVKALRAERTA